MQILKRYRLPAIVLVVVFCSLFTFTCLSTNKASIEYREAVWRNNGLAFPPKNLPDQHPRKILWLIIENFSQKRFDAIIKLARGEIEAGRGQSIYHLYLGRAYEINGQTDLAFTEWELSNNSQEIVNSAQRLLGNNQPDAAVQIIIRALSKWPQSQYRGDWLFYLGEGYTAQQEWDLSMQAYLESISATNLSDELKAIAYINAGMAAYFNGRGFSESERLIKNGLLLDPEKSKGYEILGDILIKEKRSAEALQMYSEAARRSPTDPWLVVKQVEILFDNNHWEESRTMIDAGIKQFPGQPHFHYLQAVYFKHSQQIDAAILAAEKSIDLSTTDNSGYKLFLSSLYEIDGKIEDALVLCRQVLISDQGNTTAKDCIARLEKHR